MFGALCLFSTEFLFVAAPPGVRGDRVPRRRHRAERHGTLPALVRPTGGTALILNRFFCNSCYQVSSCYIGFFLVLLGFTGLLPGFIVLCWVYPSFTRFLPSNTGLYRVFTDL